MKRVSFVLLLVTSVLAIPAWLQAQSCTPLSLQGTYMVGCYGFQDLHNYLPSAKASTQVPYASFMKITLSDPAGSSASWTFNAAGLFASITASSVSGTIGADCNGTVVLKGTGPAGVAVTETHKIAISPDGAVGSSIVMGSAATACEWTKVNSLQICGRLTSLGTYTALCRGFMDIGGLFPGVPANTWVPMVSVGQSVQNDVMSSTTVLTHNIAGTIVPTSHASILGTTGVKEDCTFLASSAASVSGSSTAAATIAGIRSPDGSRGYSVDGAKNMAVLCEFTRAKGPGM